MMRQGDLQPRQLVLAVLAAGVGVIENLLKGILLHKQ